MLITFKSYGSSVWGYKIISRSASSACWLQCNKSMKERTSCSGKWSEVDYYQPFFSVSRKHGSSTSFCSKMITRQGRYSM